MSLLQLVRVSVGQVGVQPGSVKMLSSDSLATITTAGYLNGAGLQLQEVNLSPLDVIDCMYAYDAILGTASYAMLVVSISNGVITLTSWVDSANVLLPVVSGDFAVFNGTAGQIKDAGYSASDPAKTVVAMVGSAVVLNRIAHFIDTAGTIDDTAAAVTNAGDIYAGLSGTAGVLRSYSSTGTRGYFGITAVANNADYAAILSNKALGQSTTWSLPDPGASTADILISSLAAGQSVASASSSATPGTVRALKGLMTLSNATYANTTNSVAGVRGEVDMVGASSGYVYGVQGKVIPTGTLSGSIWAPAVFGQYDLSGATLNAGQIAAIWGDMGATGGTFTDVTGARMFAGTNTIASLTLNSMIYLYGKATNLFELSGSSSTYIAAAGGGTPGGDMKTLAITIDGVTHYILAAATWS